jgi:hypothetical protein
MCALAGVSRSGFYRFPPDPAGPDRNMKLRDALQRIALEFPSYGWPRMTAELRRRGWVVNHKRVYRLMRQDNLLCLRRRRFVVTTDSGHGLPVYPNVARTLTLTGLDQLWVADITYIRLELEFVYLAVILDAFSRRVIGWALAVPWKPRSRFRPCTWRWRGDDPAVWDWCITPIAACNTPAPITRNCSKTTASASVCRGKPIPGTMPRANRL